MDQPALFGKNICVSAGPTREPLDPVRYISNNSSGKMGYLIAEAARDAGAEVTLLSGPVALTPPEGIKVISFTTAADLLDLSLQLMPYLDAYVACAAVCDVRPALVSDHKLKKGKDDLSTVHLVENPDILAALCQARTARLPRMVGFAAETQHMVSHAQKKLAAKRCDWIVGAQVSTPHTGFGSSHLDAALIDSSGVQSLGIIEKTCLAFMIVERLGLEISQYAR